MKNPGIRVSFVLALVFGIVAGPIPSLAQSQQKPVFLQGSAEEHVERMDPVDPQLQAGSVFNQQAIQQPQPNNEWYWIPSWYAGTKRVDSERILQDYNFRTGQMSQPNRVVTNRQQLSIGFQADKNGQVWEFKRAPYTTTVEGDGFFTTLMVKNRDPLKVTQDVVVLRLVQTSINVDQRSQRILKTMQEEQINTYTPGPNGVMNMQTSIKTFDSNGNPELQETSVRTVYTTAPFQPVDTYQGRDMKMLFKSFLLTHGLSGYMPPD